MPDAFASAAANTFADAGSIPVRLSGTFFDRPDPGAALGAYYYASNNGVVYESTGKTWIIRGALSKGDVAGHASGLEADRPYASKMVGWIYHATDTNKDYEAFPSKEDSGAWLGPPPPAAFTGGGSDSHALLRASLSNQFGGLFRSTGDYAIPTPTTHIVAQTLDVSPANPCVLRFEQFILDPFAGNGQLDLVERDAVRRVSDGVATDGSPVISSATMNWQPEDEGKIIRVGTNPGQVRAILSVEDTGHITANAPLSFKDASTGLVLEMEGETEVTIATKDGFGEKGFDNKSTPGWRSFVKTIDTDKVYLANFTPGDTGDGAFSVSVQTLLEER